MARPDQTTDNDQAGVKNPNLVGAGPHGTYYEFATGHVGQDEEHLGDDNRAWDKLFNGAPGPNAKGDGGKTNNSKGTQAF